MGLLSGFGDGWNLLKKSLRVIKKYPSFLVPLFFSWGIIASVVLYVRWYFSFPNSIPLIILYLYLFVFVMALSISFGNIMMLEFVQQIETGKKISFGKAFKESVSKDFIKMVPIAIIWGIIWTVIVILEAVASKAGGRSEPSARDAARTLGGMEGGPFSWFKLSLSMFRKLVRMTIFLTLPSIAWEDKGPISSFKRGAEIIKKHAAQFLGSYTMTLFAGMIMALPLVPVFVLDDMGYTFPAIFWTWVIIYEAIIWTLNIYFEQMSTGLLYLWHLKWVNSGGEGDIDSVPKPSLLDKVHELKEERIPPDLEKWIEENLERGYTPEELRKSLVKSGRDPNWIDKYLSKGD